MFFRKAIVLIHGFAGGPWDHQNLSNELQLFIDFDVYNIILPGHDKSIITNVKRNDWISSVECLCDKLIDSSKVLLSLLSNMLIIKALIVKKAFLSLDAKSKGFDRVCPS